MASAGRCSSSDEPVTKVAMNGYFIDQATFSMTGIAANSCFDQQALMCKQHLFKCLLCLDLIFFTASQQLALIPASMYNL